VVSVKKAVAGTGQVLDGMIVIELAPAI